MICASHSPLMFCYKKEPQRWNELQQAIKTQHDAIRDFDPELVIAFGSDHFNGFFLKMMPSFCVGFKAEALNDIGGFPGQLDVPMPLALELARNLRSQDIDTSVSYAMTVDHAFSQTLHFMLGSVGARPVIPIFINCITDPFVPFNRTRMMGEAVGRFCRSLGRKILILASGGMSHHPTRYYPAMGDGTPEVEAWQISGGEAPGSLTREQWLQRLHDMHHEGAEMIVRGERTAKDMCLSAESDKRFLDAFTANNLDAFDNWQAQELIEAGGIGSMELHTWLAAANAHKECGGNAPQIGFYDVAPEIGIAAGVVYAD